MGIGQCLIYRWQVIVKGVFIFLSGTHLASIFMHICFHT